MLTCFVKKRVDGIRTSFRKELGRVRDSKRSVSSADDVYKPTLWYFDLSSDTPSPVCTYSNQTPSATPDPVHSPEQNPGTVYTPY
jgi:transglutaminase-like putative cysteine protease